MSEQENQHIETDETAISQEQQEQLAVTATGQAQPAEDDGDVMDILESVERQFDRLRDAQTARAGEVTSLSKRAADLDEREEQLEGERRSLEIKRREAEETLAQQLASLAAQQDEANQIVEERLAELEQTESALVQREESLKASLLSQEEQRLAIENQLRDVEEAQRVQAEKEEDLERRLEEFGDFKQRLSVLQERMVKAEGDVTELNQQVEQSNEQLAAKQTMLDAAGEKQSEQEQRIGELEQEVQKAQENVARGEQEAMEMLQDAEAQAASLKQQIVEAKTAREEVQSNLKESGKQLQATQLQLEESRTQLQHSQSELESTNEQLRFRREQIDQLNQQLAQQEEHLRQQQAEAVERDRKIVQTETELTDSKRKLNLAGEKLKKFSMLLAEQSPELERGSAATAMLEQQRAQIDRLTRQLAENKVCGDPEELTRRDERIQELTEALKQARGQVAGQPDAFALEQRNAELQKQMDALRLELENAQLAANESQQQLQQKLEEASADEHAGRRFEIERDELVEQITDLQNELRRARDEATEAIQAAVGAKEEAVAAAKAHAETARLATEANDEGGRAEELAEEAERLAQKAEHLRRREERVTRMQQLLKSGRREDGSPDPKGEQTARMSEQVQLVQEERAKLTDIHKTLVHAEKRMLRRWGRGRALSTVGWMIILIGAAAAGSWFAADALFPPKVVATVSMAARTSEPAPLTDEDLSKWQRWHTELVYSEEFHEDLAGRMTDLRLDEYRTVGDVADLVVRDLSIDSDNPGEIILSLSATEPEHAQLLLDVVASSVAAQSKKQMSKRGSRAYAIALGQREEGGRVRFASVGPIPIADERLIKAGPIFGGVVLLLMMMVGIVYTRVSKARRVLDEDLFADADELEAGESQTLVPLG